MTVPTMGPPRRWTTLAPPTLFVAIALGRLTDPTAELSPLAFPLLAVWFGLSLLGVLNARTWTVTIEGTTVEVRGRWGRTRFALDAVRSVVDPMVDGARASLRVEGAERWWGRWRLPRLAAWPQLVVTGVHPSYWVRHAGIPEDRVRGGGVSFRRRGLP